MITCRRKEPPLSPHSFNKFRDIADALRARVIFNARHHDRPASTIGFSVTRFVVDASAVLHLASAGIKVSARHKLLAPTLLRSQTLSALHEAVQRGEIPADVARDRLARIGRMPIRLLGDAVLRRRAWELGGSVGDGRRPTMPSTLPDSPAATGGRVCHPAYGAGTQRRRDRRNGFD